MARPTRKQYAQKMQAMKCEHEAKQDAKATSEDRFATEQAKLKAAFLGRAKCTSAARLETA